MPAENVFAEILNRVRGANVALIAAGYLPAGIDQSRVTVEPPREATHGDMATNAAMVLAKEAGKKPRELAERIAERLRADELVDKVEVAGPGFINLTLKPGAWIEALRGAVRLGVRYGASNIGAGTPVNVEYVSANPTGPLHIGHCRGAVFGDALANLLAFTGFAVTREYYINDAGAQVDVLARSAYLRYREALGETIGVIPEGLYPGDYLKPVGAALAAQYGDTLRGAPEPQWLPVVRAKAIEMMMALIREDLASLGIEHEVFFSELSLHESPNGGPSKIAETIAFLEAKDLLYRGTLPPPKGKMMEDWEPRELLLFRATRFGDDVDRPILKSDGSPAYITPDIAYHRDKFERGFANMIDVLGADHAGYVKRLNAAVEAVSGGRAVLDVKVCQLVRFLRDGEPAKMSKRTGELVTVRQVVDEVGSDAIRFMMLFRKNDAMLDFDLARVIEQSRDNPVFYVQYGHARGQSVLRNARAIFPDLPADLAGLAENVELNPLSDPAELGVMRRIALYPRVVEAAALAHEPHRIAFYLFDLASEFHALWTLGTSAPHLRFIIQNDRETTAARLVLVQGVIAILASGLALLGVSAPDEMR
ncbi:MAG: arginine--tRNA ligase [Xanthobacteraceae bacterium]